MLLFILLVMPYFTSEPIKQETITSTISYVGEPTTINGKSAYDTRFKLPDDTEVEMWVMQSPYPKIGDQVPLNVEHLSNGKKVYRIDYTKWRLGTNN
ncbi:MAG TPA: hypothetical protein ENK98_05905 [Epsilonproteobacteria bacterium]|nr:hypothetical protein [Campylobacterota bacterium]